MSRPMASHVSTLSGFVANGHQAIQLVSSALSKIPYGGFSPVRLQTDLTAPRSSSVYRRLIRGQRPDLCRRCLVRKRAFAQAASPESIRTARPVALGSPTGCAVRPAHRLLWPHLRLWNHRAVYELCRTAQPFGLPAPEGPHFTLSVLARVPSPLPQWFWCLRLTMSSAPILPSPSPEWLGNHVSVGTEISTVCFMEPQRSLNAAARRASLPCFGQDFYNRACVVTGHPTAT